MTTVAEQKKDAEPEVDARVMGFVEALTPAVGKDGEAVAPPSDDQKALARQIQKLLEEANKKVSERKPDEQKVRQEYDKFFAAAVADREAHQKADELKKKEDEAIRKAYEAAGQPQPAAQHK